MSTKYNDLDLTTFPDQIDAQQIMKDPTKDQLVSILAYETMLRSGDYDNAAVFLSSHPELAEMQITAEKMNRHEQMIIAIQRMFKEDIEEYIEAAKEAVTEDLQNQVDTANFTADSAFSQANSAKQRADQALLIVNNKTAGTVRVDGNGFYSLGTDNWTQNENGLYEKTFDVQGLTINSRLRYMQGEDTIGLVFIAGVFYVVDGVAKVICYSKPTVPLKISFCVESVNN